MLKEPIEYLRCSWAEPGEVEVPSTPKTIEEIYLKEKKRFDEGFEGSNEWANETIESVESFPGNAFFKYCEAMYTAAKNPSYSFTREDAEKAFTKSLLPLPSKNTKSPPDK